MLATRDEENLVQAAFDSQRHCWQCSRCWADGHNWNWGMPSQCRRAWCFGIEGGTLSSPAKFAGRWEINSLFCDDLQTERIGQGLKIFTFSLESGMRVCTWGTGEQEGGTACWLQTRTVTDQSRVYFPHVLCRVQHHRFEQGPSRGYFLVCSTCGQHTLIAMDCATVEKSTSWTGLASRLLEKLGGWKVPWMRVRRTCCGFSSSLAWDYTFYVADYRFTATAVWLGYFVWNGTWGT